MGGRDCSNHQAESGCDGQNTGRREGGISSNGASDITNPMLFGSGGANAYYYGTAGQGGTIMVSRGGAGGGRIVIDTPTLRMGSSAYISSDGAGAPGGHLGAPSYYAYGGGGSGGTVNVVAGTYDQISGTSYF